MKLRYSGDKSAKFWRKVQSIKDRKTHDLVYAAGCNLQEQEAKVLEMLHRARSSHVSKAIENTGE